MIAIIRRVDPKGKAGVRRRQYPEPASVVKFDRPR
jgi:hypothetical protein